MPDYNLAAVENINTVVEQIRSRNYKIAPTEWYNQMLLDTIKLKSEHYVHVKYAETKEYPAGQQTMTLRRWGGLTAHTEPLQEGIPPKADKTSMESISVSSMAFGRYMEFTDRVNLDQIDPQLMIYSKELGDVAVRTYERYARKEMLSSANEYIANQRNNPGELVFGDILKFDDFRYIKMRMQRLMVEPRANGMFQIIGSPEVKHDLMNDATLEKYMNLEQTGQAYISGNLPPLFQMQFEETMFDEYYTELDHPGEYTAIDSNSVLKHYLRVFREVTPGVFHFINIPENDGAKVYRVVETDVYLSDGSAIPKKIKWDVAAYITDKAATTVKGTIQTVATNTVVYNQDITITAEDIWTQLPIHRSILLGKDALIKTGISGQSGAQTFVKPLGSTGVLDPINQRQSIGFKINSVGFTLLRDEACVVLYSVPTLAIDTVGLMQTQLVGYSGKQQLTEAEYNALAKNALDANYDEILNKVKGE